MSELCRIESVKYVVCTKVCIKFSKRFKMYLFGAGLLHSGALWLRITLYLFEKCVPVFVGVGLPCDTLGLDL